VNVLIGENGCGKSNILEAIAFAAAAASGTLNHELLAHRGIRATEPQLMRSAFAAEYGDREIRIAGRGTPPVEFDLSMTIDLFTSLDIRGTRVRRASPVALPIPYYLTSWKSLDNLASEDVRGAIGQGKEEFTAEVLEAATRKTRERKAERHSSLVDFRIYAPENSALRFFQIESQVSPVGVDGTGLYAYLKALSANEHSARFAEITERLTLLDWFERLEIPKAPVALERKIDIRDRYLAEGALFDQRSANKGFLFLLFYFTLFISPHTPTFFAVDNIDASLNPKLCAELMRQVVELAEKHNKQVILTTHNPAVLDGLNLRDDEQRLLVAHRNIDGHTKVHRVDSPKPIEGVPPVALSDAFMRGYIGGLPENF
jgi:predicted ATPase